jgi:hypothetical protein
MFTRPAATPDTIPLLLPTTAVAGVPVLHDPPATLLNNVVLLPAQTTAVPVIAAGVVLTVAIVVVKQPVLAIM